MKRDQKKRKIKMKISLAKLYKETKDIEKVREHAEDEKLSVRKVDGWIAKLSKMQKLPIHKQKDRCSLYPKRNPKYVKLEAFLYQ